MLSFISLIKDGIQKPMTINKKLLIKSIYEAHLKTPTEIKLSEFDPTLLEFKQYTYTGSTSRLTRDISYGDYHKPYLCCTKRRGIDLIKAFQ